MTGKLKYEVVEDAPPSRTQEEATIALLPAGGEVWEDFLDNIGVSLEQFCREGPGGWILGYSDALSRSGVRTVLILLSERVRSPLRFAHAGSGARITVLPVPRAYRALHNRLMNCRSLGGERGERRGGVKRSLWRSLCNVLQHAVPHLSTPLLLLARELRREGCTAILCQEYEFFRFDTCVLLGRFMRVPVFATFQGSDFEPNLIGRFLRPLTMRACSGLVVASGTEIERVGAHYSLQPGRVVQVFNPVDAEMWTATNRAAARAVFKLPENARVAVWHGRVIVELKGLDILLDAWERVCRERPGRDLRLLLMGTGCDAELMRQRIASLPMSNVLWINQYVTDRSEVRCFLSAGDVYAFPSRYEGFPVAPIEAMACGLPVVAAEASGIPDIFKGGEASGGIVVPRGNCDAFAEALGRVLDDQALGRNLGALARRRVEEAFSLERVGMLLRSFLLRSGIAATESEKLGTVNRVIVK